VKTILSVQSHVAYGHVGNAAAVFPLQRLGHEVIAVNTVQFSNHTGYGKWTGEVFSGSHVRSLFDGLEALGALGKVDALLTGYLGDAATGEAVMDALSRLPAHALWLCDPVMGDVGRGFFAREGVPEFFKTRALPQATIITPNLFELEYLSDRTISTLAEARDACRALHAQGPDIILLTSMIVNETPPGCIQMLACSRSGEQHVATTPLLPLEPPPNGAGDFTAAVFLAHVLSGADAKTALSRTAASIYAVFEETFRAGTRELALIAAQDRFIAFSDNGADLIKMVSYD